MKNILEEGGSSLSSVVKTTVLLADIEDFKEVNEVYSECMDPIY
jgi:2-iminobutanoate/2-iminopropanoate deaminase